MISESRNARADGEKEPTDEKANRLTVVMLAAVAAPTWAADAGAPAQAPFTSVHVFDGVSGQRTEKTNVLVEGILIKQVGNQWPSR